MMNAVSKTFSHPDKQVSLLSTCRDEIIHDFSGTSKFFFTTKRTKNSSYLCHPEGIYALVDTAVPSNTKDS
jgi:hypothetical protein